MKELLTKAQELRREMRLREMGKRTGTHLPGFQDTHRLVEDKTVCGMLIKYARMAADNGGAPTCWVCSRKGQFTTERPRRWRGPARKRTTQ